LAKKPGIVLRNYFLIKNVNRISGDLRSYVAQKQRSFKSDCLNVRKNNNSHFAIIKYPHGLKKKLSTTFVNHISLVSALQFIVLFVNHLKLVRFVLTNLIENMIWKPTLYRVSEKSIALIESLVRFLTNNSIKSDTFFP